MSEPSAPEKPSRYNRSFGGLVIAMAATLLFVAAYVGFRAVSRDQPSGSPSPVDYLDSVRALQEADVTVVYPSDLPTGWVPTSARYERGAKPAWGIGIVTSTGDFVGVQQQAVPIDQLLKSYLDGDARAGRPATVESLFGRTWQTWTTQAGDHAFSLRLSSGPLSGENLLVYGSASVRDQEQLIELLTTDRLPPRQSSPRASPSGS